MYVIGLYIRRVIKCIGNDSAVPIIKYFSQVLLIAYIVTNKAQRKIACPSPPAASHQY